MNIKPDIQNLIFLILSGEVSMDKLIDNRQAMRLNKHEGELLNAIIRDKRIVSNRKKHSLCYLWMRVTDRLFPEKKEVIQAWTKEIEANRMANV